MNALRRSVTICLLVEAAEVEVSVNEVVVTHLRAAKAALLQERVKLDAAVADLDRLLRDYAVPDEQTASADGRPGLASVSALGGPSTSGVPQMRDAILHELRETGPVKAGDLAASLAVRYGWQAASVRSLLAKLASLGEVAQLARGLYEDAERAKARQQLEGHKDAEAPADTGASDGEEPSEGSSRKEGGSADGAESPFGRDGSGDTEFSHGHGHRASIEEAIGV